VRPVSDGGGGRLRRRRFGWRWSWRRLGLRVRHRNQHRPRRLGLRRWRRRFDRQRWRLRWRRGWRRCRFDRWRWRRRWRRCLDRWPWGSWRRFGRSWRRRWRRRFDPWRRWGRWRWCRFDWRRRWRGRFNPWWRWRGRRFDPRWRRRRRRRWRRRRGLGGLRRRRGCRGLALQQCAQRGVGAVVQHARLEVARASPDDGLGDLDHLARDAVGRTVGKIGGSDLVGPVQGRHDEARAARLDHHGPLAAAHGGAADADATVAVHRHAQRVQRIGGDIPFGIDVADRIDEDAIDLVARYELLDVEDIVGTAGQTFQLVRGQHDVVAAVGPEALGKGIRGDDIAGLGIDELLGHRIAGAGIDLVEPNALPRGYRRRQTHRAGHKGNSQIPLPNGLSHRRPPLRRCGSTITRYRQATGSPKTRCARFPTDQIPCDREAPPMIFCQSIRSPSFSRVPAFGIGYLSPLAQLNSTARSAAPTRPSVTACL